MDRENVWRWLAPVLIVGCVLLVFGRGLASDFQLWDDGLLILDNPAVRTTSPAAIFDAWKAPHEHLYIPVTYNAWNLLARIASRGDELSPAVFHGANIVVHIICVMLVYRLAMSLGLGQMSLVAALIFAVHPLQVEPVAWASGMKDLLSGALALMASLCYVQAAKDGRRGLYVVAAAALALGTFAKPGVAGVPFMLLLMDRLALKSSWRTALLRVIPMVIAVLPATVLTPIVQPASELPVTPLMLRPAVAADALAFYAWKMVWPVRLCTDYSQAPDVVLKSGRTLWTWIVPMAIAIGALLAVKRRPLVACGLAMAFAGFLPVLGLVPFGFQYYSTTGDRYAYLPMVGIAVAVAALLQGLDRRAIVAMAGVLVALGALSFIQVGTWRNTQTLEGHAAKVNGTSPWSRTRLAVWYGMQKDYARSEEETWRSLSLRYDYVLPMNNAVTLQLVQGKQVQAIRTAECMQRIARIWGIEDAKLQYGRAWSNDGRRALHMPPAQTLPSSP